MIPAFSACTESPEPGIRTSTHLVRDAHHLDLALAGPDRLEEDHVAAGGVEQQQGLERRLRQASQVPAGSHRADEHARVEEVIDEADPVAEQRALRERARGVDRDDADGQVEGPHVAHERADQRRLADARRAGDPDREGRPRVRIELLDDGEGAGIAVLDERDRPGQGPAVARQHAGDELLVGPGTTRHRRHSTVRTRLFRTADAVEPDVVGSSRMLGQFTAQFAIVRMPEHRGVPQPPARPADLGPRHVDGVLRGPHRALQPDELRLVGQHPALRRARARRHPRDRGRAADRPLAAPADDDPVRPRRRRLLRRAPVRSLSRRDLRRLGAGGLLGRVLPPRRVTRRSRISSARSPSLPRTRSCREPRTSPR